MYQNLARWQPKAKVRKNKIVKVLQLSTIPTALTVSLCLYFLTGYYQQQKIGCVNEPLVGYFVGPVSMPFTNRRARLRLKTRPLGYRPAGFSLP